MAKKKYDTVADLPGVGDKTADKLIKAGYSDPRLIAMASENELIKTAGLGEGTAQKIIVIARDSLYDGYEPATIIMEKRKAIGKVSTGSKALDELLGGGVESQSITEVFGAYGSAKTQIAHQLSVTVQLPVEEGGMGGSVLYIDSENSFRPERIKQMAEARGLDVEKVLENIFVGRAYSSDHQIILIKKAAEMIKEKNIKLVIVDSITGQFRTDYSGRGELAVRQQKLSKHVKDLQKLSEGYNLVVFVTNQVMSNPGLLFGDPTTAVGGHVLHHATKTRIYLRRSKAGTRICRLVDSPHLPDGECLVRITENGVEDLEGKK
jgi:DNA repair protein RadA